MSNLSAFLHPIRTIEEKDVVISDRFVDEKGEPLPFRIRALTQEENAKCRKAATRSIKVNGMYQEKLDSDEYNTRLIVAATVDPDFSDAKLCDGYGTKDPVAVPGKMLLAGEFVHLSAEIIKLSGFEDSPEEEAKN